VKRAIEEDTPERIEARKDVAKENSWEGKVQKLLQIIERELHNP
jgi:hypothetical protein